MTFALICGFLKHHYIVSTRRSFFCVQFWTLGGPVTYKDLGFSDVILIYYFFVDVFLNFLLFCFLNCYYVYNGILWMYCLWKLPFQHVFNWMIFALNFINIFFSVLPISETVFFILLLTKSPTFFRLPFFLFFFYLTPFFCSSIPSRTRYYI